MKAKFQYSRIYTFETCSGNPYCRSFSLVERFGEAASFRMLGNRREDNISTPLEMEGDVETAAFLYFGREYSLRADRYQSKEYPMTIGGRLEKKDDTLKDLHLHTIYNRDEVELSHVCHCISCQASFPPAQIDSYADNGVTALCPYCGCDAVLGDGCGMELTGEWLEKLHRRYFNYND